MLMRDLSKMQSHNDGNRSLFESSLVPEINSALKDWITYSGEGVVIGGMAFSYHHKPRMTMDIDLLFLSEDDIPSYVEGFKKTREHAFLHKKTHVEIEVLSPEFLKIEKNLVDKVNDAAQIKDGIKVASPTGIVALKLGRLKNNDIGDIINLSNTYDVDLTGWPVSDEMLSKYKQILEI